MFLEQSAAELELGTLVTCKRGEDRFLVQITHHKSPTRLQYWHNRLAKFRVQHAIWSRTRLCQPSAF